MTSLYDFTTDSVTVTGQSGTGFTVDVTNCNLGSDLTVKDFLVYVDGALNTNGNWTKTDRTTLTYGGTALTSATILIRRATDVTQFEQVEHLQTLSSSLWNTLVGSLIRLAEEYRLYGVGPDATAGGSVNVIDTAFSAAWNGDTVNAASRNVLYDEIILKAGTVSPAFTGTPTVPNVSPGDNSTTIANTAYVDSTFAPLASPALTGTPSAPTAGVADNTTRIATTAYVQSNKALTDANVAANVADITTLQTDKADLDSPAFTGTPTAVTTAQANDSTRIATTAFVQDVRDDIVATEIAANASDITDLQTDKANLAGPAFTGTPTAPTANPEVDSTQIATTAYVRDQVAVALLVDDTTSSNFNDSTPDAIGFSRFGAATVGNSSVLKVQAISGDGSTDEHRIVLKSDGWYHISFVATATCQANAESTFRAKAQVYDDTNATNIGPLVQARNRLHSTTSGSQIFNLSHSFWYRKTTGTNDTLHVIIELAGNLGGGAVRTIDGMRFSAALMIPE